MKRKLQNLAYLAVVTTTLAATLATASALAGEPPTDQAADPTSEVVMEEIVVTGELSRFGATRATTPILETSRSVAIIDEETFRARGALTLDDTLSYTAGVIGDTFGFSTRGDFAKVRGFDAAEYRDGQQVLFGFYNNTRSDVYMLDQVEVLKGPASVLYGKGTPGGIVNAISKVARPDAANELLLDIGENNRYQVAADYSIALSDHWFARLVGVYRDSDTQVDNVEDDALILMPSITWKNESTTLSFLFEYAQREGDTAHQFLPLTGTACASGDVSVTPIATCANANGTEISYDTYLGDPSFNRFDTTSTLFSLLGSHSFNEHVSLEGVARYKHGEADYRQSWISFVGAGNPRVDALGNGLRSFYVSDASSEQLALDLRLRLDFATGPIEHEVFLGFVYQDVTTDNDTQFIYGQGSLNIYNPVYGGLPTALTDGTPLFDGPQAETRDIGWYANDQLSFGNWRVNLGVRVDDTETESGGASQKEDETSLSAGVLYAFDSGISPYLNYAESFEPVVGVNSVTGEFLQPREGEQIEAGLKYQPRGSQTYITLAYFDIEESNLANPSSLITSPILQQEGIGEVQGFELEAQTRIGDWYLEGAVTLLDTESAEGVSFDSIPERQISSWVQYEPATGSLAGFRFGLGVRFVEENESNSVATGVRVVTDGYVVADTLVGYETDRWDATINVRNLTDEDYYGTCLARGDCFPGEARSVVGRIRFKL